VTGPMTCRRHGFDCAVYACAVALNSEFHSEENLGGIRQFFTK
jgi:hypothetical protein